MRARVEITVKEHGEIFRKRGLLVVTTDHGTARAHDDRDDDIYVEKRDDDEVGEEIDGPRYPFNLRDLFVRSKITRCKQKERQDRTVERFEGLDSTSDKSVPGDRVKEDDCKGYNPQM